VGYFSFNGNLDTCITIRTALNLPNCPHPVLDHPLPLLRARDGVQAGGGWVNDSEPEAEFQETVNKSKAIRLRNPATARQMLKAVALAETIAKTA
jgi:anthranilate synthase component I